MKVQQDLEEGRWVRIYETNGHGVLPGNTYISWTNSWLVCVTSIRISPDQLSGEMQGEVTVADAEGHPCLGFSIFEIEKSRDLTLRAVHPFIL